MSAKEEICQGGMARTQADVGTIVIQNGYRTAFPCADVYLVDQLTYTNLGEPSPSSEPCFQIGISNQRAYKLIIRFL